MSNPSRNRLDRLIRRLTLEEESPEVFVGGAGEGGIGAEARLFGGLVAAQAVIAAQRTVFDFPMHSLHAYFLRPGRAEHDIAYHVTAMKDGRNFRARRVEAWQGGDCIFQLISSFQRPEPGLTHQPPMPEVRPPEECANRDQLKGRTYWRDMPVDVRMVTDITADEPRPAEQRLWLRANGELPDDSAVHLAMVVYASDRCLLDTAFRPHAGNGELIGASLDHVMWFHEVPRFDDWLLYTTEAPVARNSRGLANGLLYTRDGGVIASVAQEGLMRLRT
ncbi:MAG: thioesterase family protein [Pseudomonadales bacterium]|jgi:acyl-CoA thioesterase-2|nr:thioesterase family protein [Pseudomonadales bacterium]MDP6470225.1 thioesterase family protein [Pseudomonadales bacterium]MDP6827131.1 thioesterase family protein [Pseudomonadales bacterium]MDP6971569.1 thioesterase family protein [Pseudomonadales bacterium]